MIYKLAPIIMLLLAGLVLAGPQITPVDFLNTDEPARMCQGYIDAEYGDTVQFMFRPTGGALARIEVHNYDECLYFFCDEAMHRLIIFRLRDYDDHRVPVGIKAYGRQAHRLAFHIPGGDSAPPDTMSAPYHNQDSVGFFYQPVDIAVSAIDRYFIPETDFLYVLDRGNMRVVKLRYDLAHDTLLWEGDFGNGILESPTAIDYADYGDSSAANDDIYVTDGLPARVFRFSAAGDLETSFGGYGSGLALMGYPTGVAVSTSQAYPDRIYISDSKNHRVCRYYSASVGPIMFEKAYVFPHSLPWPYAVPYLIALDTDSFGNVYVVDNLSHSMTMLNPDLAEKIGVIGEQGFDPGEFNYPADIYIDIRNGHDEMQVCERWDELSGIQSFTITQQFGKGHPDEQLPRRFQLYQNYPNPFNSTTTIKFDLPLAGEVTLEIYNILGQKVTTLINDDLPAGTHQIRWHGTNSAGESVASGIYLYRLKTADNLSTRKLLLLK